MEYESALLIHRIGPLVTEDVSLVKIETKMLTYRRYTSLTSLEQAPTTLLSLLDNYQSASWRYSKKMFTADDKEESVVSLLSLIYKLNFIHKGFHLVKCDITSVEVLLIHSIFPKSVSRAKKLEDLQILVSYMIRILRCLI